MTIVLAIALGLVIGLMIGTLGGGGGVLAVPALVYVLGQTAGAATTASIIVVGVVSAVGLLARLRSRTVDWRTGAVVGLIGVPAAWAGSLLNRAVAQPVLLLSFAALTVLVATIMLVDARRRRQNAGKTGRTAGDPRPADGPPSGPGGTATAVLEAPAEVLTAVRARVGRMVLAGAAVGFLTGFLGVGGGFLVVPALVMALGLSMPNAIATSLLVITINSASSLVARAGHLELDWHILLPFAAIAVLGALVGTGVGRRLSAAALTRGFAVVLLAIGALVGLQSLLALGG